MWGARLIFGGHIFGPPSLLVPTPSPRLRTLSPTTDDYADPAIFVLRAFRSTFFAFG